MMPGPRELPQLIGEFIHLAKGYLRQETIEPAKRLVRAAGFGIAAGLAFLIGAVLLSVAAVRLVIEVLPGEPDSPYWSALGYGAAAVGLAVVTALVVKVASK